MDPLANRLLSPLYVPLLLLIVSLGDRWGQSLNGLTPRQWAGDALTVAMLLWLSYPLLLTMDAVRYGPGTYRAPWCYSSPRWQDSALLAALRSQPLRGKVYSNFPDAVYLFAGIPAALSPREFHYNSRSRDAGALSRFHQVVRTGVPIYLIWFEQPSRPFLYEIEDLRSCFRLSKIETCSDGGIYRVRM
jgi:hypothetical protein